MLAVFDQETLPLLCNQLAAKDEALQTIITTYGYPPFWSRTPSFATLIHIILEQQVSLASAKAAFIKLHDTIAHITPEAIVQLTDAELKQCYFSRQKAQYAKALANAVLLNELNFESLQQASNEEVHRCLTRIKGIGSWTADVFLMMALHRCDCFPTGDVALINSMREVLQLPKATSKDALLAIAERWKPNRTIAAFLLWHNYIKKRNMQV